MNDTNQEILDVVNQISADLINDRSKIDDIIIRLGTLEARVKALYERLPRTEDKMYDAMTEAAQPILDVLEKSTIVVEKKPMITKFIDSLKEGVKMNGSN